MRKTLAAVITAGLVITSAGNAFAYNAPAGKIAETYNANGGAAVFGESASNETKIVAYSRNTYHQHFENGVVYWDGSMGGKVWMNGNVPPLSGVVSERDALGRYGYAAGELFRSAKLCGATTADKRLITAMLHGGAVLDLRTSGTCAEPTFPSGVTLKRISIPSHADYSRYVTGATEQKQFAAAIRFVLHTDGPVWIHCTEGKDRTGWLVALIMFALDMPYETVKEEFLRTSGADEDDFLEALGAIEYDYGTPEVFLRQGIGLSDSEIMELGIKLNG